MPGISTMAGFEEPTVGLSGAVLLAQGAEAKVWKLDFMGRPTILKQRFSKKYRHATLDTKITQSRFKQEVRSMLRARKLGVCTPVVYFVEHDASALYLEAVAGKSVKDLINHKTLSPSELETVLAEIGRVVGLLHDGGIIHGDLTTSNMMIRDVDQALVLIDFGLSSNSTVPEDKAVDLYVLERAFISAHSTAGDLFDVVLAAYKRSSRQWSATLNKFAEVRLRGRKRAMVG